MAVFDQIPGVKVTVQICGQDAAEYVDPHASESDPDDHHECPIVSRYIESIDDAEFSIKVAIDDEVYAWDDMLHVLSVRVQIDGRKIRGKIIQRGCKFIVVRGVEEYLKSSQLWLNKTFKFSAINTVDDNDLGRVQKDMNSVKGVGLIQVTLERRVKEKRVPTTPESVTNASALEVAEKSLKKKFVSHSTSFGKDKVIQPSDRWRTSLVSTDKGPIVVFRFIYRSKEGLKQELVIPRTPPPELAAPAIWQSVRDLTMSELQRLAQERLDQIKAEAAESPIKNEAKGDINSTYISTMKRELIEIVDSDEEAEKARPAKRPAVTVDLTDN
ncbi:hypothetical protein F5Y03DRAFT_406964 [Xylaria venustula]|nr:hypothetical protein F5Y03DRAFT_406964 [Xylaria venustula]